MNIRVEIKLREWQNKAFNAWIDNQYNGIFSIVTGGGKTVFGIYCLAYLFKNKFIESVLIIVPTKTLQDQWASNIIQFTDLSIQSISFNKTRPRKITILTNISAQRLPKDFFSSKLALVLDECHRYGTDRNIAYLKHHAFSKIGLTATLERKYDDGVSRILKPLIGDVIYDYSIKQALEDGVVEPYKMVYLRTHFNEDEELNYLEISTRISKISARLNSDGGTANRNGLEKTLEMLLFKRRRLVNETDQRKYVAAKIIVDNLERKKILFCESISQAEAIQELCKNQGLSTAVYHSDMKRSERIAVLTDFQSNFFHTLIGCKALDEGFDVPDIDFGIIVSQTKTTRQRIQRLGRTIRKGQNKKKPIIYTLYSTEDEYRALYEEQFNNPNIEVEWKEVK
jgi:superfamily II DNA or RNA helicase